MALGRWGFDTLPVKLSCEQLSDDKMDFVIFV